MTNILLEYEIDRKGNLKYGKPCDYNFNEESDQWESYDTFFNYTDEEIKKLMSKLVEKDIIELQYPTSNGILTIVYDTGYLEYDFCVNFGEIGVNKFYFDSEENEGNENTEVNEDEEVNRDKEDWSWYSKKFKLSELELNFPDPNFDPTDWGSVPQEPNSEPPRPFYF